MEVPTMQLPLEIAFHNMDYSPTIEVAVREKAAKLDEFAGQIMSCRVVVEAPHRHHERGNQYQVRIDLTIPGGEIVVNREPPEHTAYRDINVALRDAFDSAKRQLEDFVRRVRGTVKVHDSLPHARVVKLFPGEGYGFLQTTDGRELYFHRNSVLHKGFNKLSIGTEVTFVEEEGNKGPQASTVKRVGRHHHA
jgi:cold shock CspA family protein/ribosome-associated translation inhibitor RaiA